MGVHGTVSSTRLAACGDRASENLGQEKPERARQLAREAAFLKRLCVAF